MVNEERVTAGWPIRRATKDRFTEFCTKTSTLAQDACAGALIAWCYLPAQIREWAILEANGNEAISAAFWDDFRRGLELALRAQLGSPQQKPATGQ